MDDKKKIRIIDWLFDTFLIRKKEKVRDIQEKKDKEKKLTKALSIKQGLIKKYNLNDDNPKSLIMEVSQQDFKKILVEENIEVVYFHMPRSARDLGVYDYCDYYFYYSGVRILTYGSMGDGGFFQHFIGPLFDESSREKYDQNILDYVSVICTSNEKLRDYLEKEGIKN